MKDASAVTPSTQFFPPLASGSGIASLRSRPPSLAWRTGRTVGYWWAYRAPSPTPHDPDHYARRLVSGLFIGLGVYVLFWPTVVLGLIVAVSFGY